MGAGHDMYADTISSTGGSGTCGPNDQRSYSSAAPDGSGYSISITNYTSAQMFTAGGHIINAPENSTSGNASRTDTNGNVYNIAVSGSTTVTDTLNQTLGISGSGTPSSPITYRHSLLMFAFSRSEIFWAVSTC